jgi:hypothetical protein
MLLGRPNESCHGRRASKKTRRTKDETTPGHWNGANRERKAGGGELLVLQTRLSPSPRRQRAPRKTPSAKGSAGPRRWKCFGERQRRNKRLGGRRAASDGPGAWGVGSTSGNAMRDNPCSVVFSHSRLDVDCAANRTACLGQVLIIRAAASQTPEAETVLGWKVFSRSL